VVVLAVAMVVMMVVMVMAVPMAAGIAEAGGGGLPARRGQHQRHNGWRDHGQFAAFGEKVASRGNTCGFLTVIRVGFLLWFVLCRHRASPLQFSQHAMVANLPTGWGDFSVIFRWS
jgi:hypothetical protein